MSEYYKARMVLLLEPVDFILKRLAQDCMKKNHLKKTQQLFLYMQDYHANFWSQFEPAEVLISQWMRMLQPHHQLLIPSVQKQIYINFLRRLSLDEWLLLSSNEDKSKTTHGNEILNIMIQVVEYTIFGLLPIPIIQQSNAPGRPRYETIFEKDNTAPMINKPSSVSALDELLSKNKEESDSEDEYLRTLKTPVYLPESKSSSRGMRIKFTKKQESPEHRREPSNRSKTKRRNKKKHTDSDDSD
jgi:hypothetical protein